MGRIQNWRKSGSPKTGYHEWRNTETKHYLWVYPHDRKIHEVRRGGKQRKGFRTTAPTWSIRIFNPKGTTIAKALNGKHFKSQTNAYNYAVKWMRKHPYGIKRGQK